MQRVVRAFPILPGREAEAREIAHQMGTERAEAAADFYRRFGVVHESWHEQHTPAGTWFIVISEIADTPVETAAKSYAASAHAFDAWFKSRVQAITGVDPSAAPLGPPTRCVFSFTR